MAEAAAKAAFAAGRYEEAAASFEAALGRSDGATPRHLLLCNLSAALHKLERHEAAARAAREAVSIEPRHAKAHYRLASALLASGKCVPALEVCDAALLLLPDHTQLLEVREACRVDGGVEEAKVGCARIAGVTLLAHFLPQPVSQPGAAASSASSGTSRGWLTRGKRASGATTDTCGATAEGSE